MTMRPDIHIDRRGLIAGGLAMGLIPGAALALPGKVTFAVFRNGTRIGQHVMTFSGDEMDRVASADASFIIKLGPVPVYRYKHRATERYRNGKFASIETSTDDNGKKLTVTAEVGSGAVMIEGPDGKIRAPADAAPLSHWNPAVFGRPLFNQQTGKMLKVRVTRAAPGHWQIRGDTEIDDFYDEAGVWRGLKGKLEDGSTMEYRRV
jgi:hypothetical protein